MSNENEKNLDVSAKTIDEAIEQGLAQLGLSREQVDITVLKEGKRGVFGIGAEEAQVRLTPRIQAGPRETARVPEIPLETPSPPKTSIPEVAAPEADSPPARTSNREPNVEEVALNFLVALLKRMGIKAQVTVRVAPDLVEPNEEPPLVLDIQGNDLGILIGRRSETLHALQYMVRLAVSKEFNKWYPLVVDVESYRVRRRRALQQMAERMAERAVASRKKVVLEAMPAHERRIIHLALKDHSAVLTKSVGSDDNRKVTIIPK